MVDDYASAPVNLPKWAPGLGSSVEEAEAVAADLAALKRVLERP